MKDTTKNTYLAVDFGGGSGRVIAGSLLQGKLELEEIHRFTNRQVKLGNHVYWDLDVYKRQLQKEPAFPLPPLLPVQARLFSSHPYHTM